MNSGEDNIRRPFEEDLKETAEQMRKTLGINVKRYRKGRKISQQALADMTGLHRTYISDLENAKSNPSLGVICSLADCLDVSIFDLLERH